jgi:hypothetical protein
MKLLFYAIPVLFFFNTVFGQTSDSSKRNSKVYHVNIPVVSVIIAAGAAADIPAIDRIKGKANITDAEISNLNPALLNFIDRWGLQQNPADRKEFQTISDNGQIPIDLLPMLLMFNKRVRKEWLGLLLMYVEGHAITFTFYNYSFLGPTFQNKYRPVTYYSQFSLSDRESGNNRNSFYSGHTASCAFATFFMAKVLCDYHPDFSLGDKILVYSAASIPPLAMGWFRVKALDHFPSDCLVGFALGSVIGVVIPELHKVRVKNVSVGMFTSPAGNGLSFHYTIPEIKKLTTIKSFALNK